MWILSLLLSAHSVMAQNYEVIPPEQWKTADNVVAFQPFATSDTQGEATLISLNANVNTWFLYRASDKAGWTNLENPYPHTQKLALDAKGQLILSSKKGDVACDPAEGAKARDPYVAICGNLLYLRNQQEGHADGYSWRDLDLGGVAQVWGQIRTHALAAGAPPAGQSSNDTPIKSTGLGVALADAPAAGLVPAQWYALRDFDGVFASVMRARFAPDAILKSFPDRVQPLNSYGGGESDAIVDSVAIDLEAYTAGWNTGTVHPGTGWSNRAPNRTGAGPDGFSTLKPLAFPGTVTPLEAERAVAVLTGGFERRHSAFKLGVPSQTNRGHHYGYMEKGVVMSTIVPNLASFIVYNNGQVDLKTWTLADNAHLSQIRDIRQNGVPLIVDGEPHPLVKERTAGNWSATAANQVLTTRTSVCLLESAQKRYLVFSYFSAASPSGMARVLQAYGCKYAIHLDMNSPRFAYSAFFTMPGSSFNIEHVSTQMADDASLNGGRAPRYLLTPSYKDFFYILRK